MCEESASNVDAVPPANMMMVVYLYDGTASVYLPAGTASVYLYEGVTSVYLVLVRAVLVVVLRARTRARHRSSVLSRALQAYRSVALVPACAAAAPLRTEHVWARRLPPAAPRLALRDPPWGSLAGRLDTPTPPCLRATTYSVA